MTAAHPDNQVTEGVPSLEVRWIFPGQAGTAVARWFGRFPAEVEAREDAYLVHPQLRGLSVKVRGGRALEVKVYRGSPGILQVAGRARLEELNDALDLDLPKGDFETLAGLVLATLHRIPLVGEVFRVRGYTVTVLEADKRRVLAVRITPDKKPTSPAAA
jgi:hypothetical protein